MRCKQQGPSPMRISSLLPIHDWVNVELPPLPSVNGKGYNPVKCKHCGIQGFMMTDNTTITLKVTDNNRHKVLECTGDAPKRGHVQRVMITHNHLYKKGPKFKHLKVGTCHTIVVPPNTSGSLEGVWVAGPMGSVKLLAGEFLTAPVRRRKRHVRKIEVS